MTHAGQMILSKSDKKSMVLLPSLKVLELFPRIILRSLNALIVVVAAADTVTVAASAGSLVLKRVCAFRSPAR